MSADTVTLVPLAALPLGAVLDEPILDRQQTKLLAAGVEITEQLLRNLARRNVDAVFVNRNDLSRLKPVDAATLSAVRGTARPAGHSLRSTYANDATRELDRQLLTLPTGESLSSADPFAKQVKRLGTVPYNLDLIRHLGDQHERGVRHLTEMIQSFVKGDCSELELVRGVVGDKLDQATDDFDAFVCVGASPSAGPYPSRHALHTAMLAMAMGTTMGLDQTSLIELGIGCWIHDVGMACVDQRLIVAKRSLAIHELVEIAKHPFKTFELIEKNLSVIPPGSRMVAYQIHERADGSGYPRGRTLAQTHPLARIAAVADMYAALVAPRPHRPGLLPYYAIEKILAEAKQGLFDPKAVRALLQTVGLFPIGSFVEFNHSEFVGRVIRANGPQFALPIVEVHRRSATGTAPAIVDLSQDATLKIARPIAP